MGRKGKNSGWKEIYPDTTYALQAHFLLIVFVPFFFFFFDLEKP